MSAANDNDAPVPEWPGKIAGNAAHDRISAMLVMDIQKSPAWANKVLGNIDDVISGESVGWETAMNAYILNVGAEISDISPVFEEAGEQTVQVKTGELRAALVAWRDRIDQ